MGNRYLFHIEILRTFALLGVIIFHVVGMIDSRIPLFSTLPMENSILQIASQWVGLAVPLFMFIAGYLYNPVAKNQTVTFIKKKLVRLWIPYCVFTILIMLTSGFFDFKAFISGGFYHLWFLTALFWCFICSLLIDYSSYWSFIVLPITLAVSLVHIPPFLGLQDFIQWYYFFVLGAIIKVYPNIITTIKQYYLWAPLLVLFVIIMVYVPFHYRAQSIIHALAESALILVIWTFSEKMEGMAKNGTNFIARMFCSFGKCSMGTYVLHYWLLIYVLSSTSVSIFHISSYLQSHPIITIFAITVVTFGICYVITLLLQRSKYGRLLIG